MENRYPLFAGGRILKKEALWDLRDYAYGGWQLYYADYTDGVIKGCNVRVEGMNLVIGKGVLKYQNFIYLLKEEARVPITETNSLAVLKAEFRKEDGNPDYLIYTVVFFLDNEPECRENQMELCRFHLRAGSVLRDTYKNFSDLNTEYDTINLLYATISGRNEERMNPEILLKYVQEIQEHDTRGIADIAFCYHVLQNKGEVERKVVEAYLQEKQGEKLSENETIRDSRRCFERLEAVLKKREGSWDKGQRQKVIFVE